VILPRLYAITDLSLSKAASHAALVELLCRGGATLIQMREKRMPDGELLRQARMAAEAARKGGARLIVDDRPDVSLLAGADGVHLGDRDLPPAAARRILKEGSVVGCSTHSAEEAIEAASSLPVDYVALGPIFATRHSSAIREPLGVAAVARAAAGVSVPLVAIGGIALDNAGEVLSAGASSVAAIGDIMTAPDIPARVAAYLAL